jgi:CDP-diglyceride synthetase
VNSSARSGNRPTRLQRIALRTLVGGTLVVAVGLLLDAAYESPDGRVVWIAAILFTAGCVFEAARLKKLVPAQLGVALWLGLALSLSPAALHYFDGRGLVPTELVGESFPTARGVALAYILGVAGTLAWSVIVGRAQVRSSLALGLSVWLLAPLPALVLIWSDFGADGLLALILLSKIGDVFGFYVGNAIGKSHPFPGISPGKTTAGCVASLVAGTLAGAACVEFDLLPGGREALLAGLLAGALINLAAQAGDLLESKLKRAAQVKDSGPWFGPSGGFLDLADSLLLAVPAALLTWPALFA